MTNIKNALFYIFQKTQSSKQQVVLTNLSLDSAGAYKCEVSAEAPSFRTKSAVQVPIFSTIYGCSLQS